VDMDQEPSELDGEGDPQVGVHVPGTLRDGAGLRDEAGASRHPLMEGRQGRQENVGKLVRLDEGDE
jgi:hypothetical protein